METLNELITLNQGILYALHVSHSHLNTIANVAHEFGMACKITGGGGGGCCFILLGVNEATEASNRIDEMIGVLNEKKFVSFRTLLGCPGVSINYKN